MYTCRLPQFRGLLSPQAARQRSSAGTTRSIERQTRDKQELNTRQINRLSIAGQVIIRVLNAQITIVVNVRVERSDWLRE